MFITEEEKSDRLSVGWTGAAVIGFGRNEESRLMLIIVLIEKCTF